MTPAQLAARLNGIEYTTRIPKELLAEAKTSGLVIVHSASDDLMEFDGAITNEIEGYDEGEVSFDAEGLLPDWNYLLDNNLFKGTFRDYFRRKPNARTIKALWGRNGYSWSYETDIPHATFDVMEDRSKYCRGIVFSLADLKADVEKSAADAEQRGYRRGLEKASEYLQSRASAMERSSRGDLGSMFASQSASDMRREAERIAALAFSAAGEKA